MSLAPDDEVTQRLQEWAAEVQRQLDAGTQPADLELPESALAVLRADVLEALELGMAAGGWPGRAHPMPPASLTTPAAFGDAFTISQQGIGLVATLPIVLAVDGASDVQLAALDRLMLTVWSALQAVRTGGAVLELLSAGPTDIDVGGPTTIGVVFTIQQGLAPRTLCPHPLVSDPSPEGPPP